MYTSQKLSIELNLPVEMQVKEIDETLLNLIRIMKIKIKNKN